MPPVQERIATLAFTLGASTAVTKTGDVPMNIAAGTLIAALSQYMESCVNNGNIPFAYIHYTFKTYENSFEATDSDASYDYRRYCNYCVLYQSVLYQSLYLLLSILFKTY